MSHVKELATLGKLLGLVQSRHWQRSITVRVTTKAYKKRQSGTTKTYPEWSGASGDALIPVWYGVRVSLSVLVNSITLVSLEPKRLGLSYSRLRIEIDRM